jgi:hypothetical protein
MRFTGQAPLRGALFIVKCTTGHGFSGEGTSEASRFYKQVAPTVLIPAGKYLSTPKEVVLSTAW